ncbi:hypothetical protein JCM8097_008526 [Rhodosporidiobolus ruineniae]
MSDRTASAGAQASTGGTGGRKPAKRATLSCSECRRLKLRCDRQVPCSSCVKRGLSSLCPDGQLTPTRTSKLAASATALAERVELLESLLRQNGHPIPPLPAAANFAIDMAARRREAQNPGGAAAAATGSAGAGGEAGASGEEDELDLVAMGSEDSASPRRDSVQEEMTAQSSSAPDQPEAAGDDRPTFPFPAATMSLKEIQEALPPKDEVVRLSNLYWDHCSYMFCPITPEDYWDDYLESAFSSDPHGPKLACVLMAISLGAAFDPALPATAPTQSQRYFDLGQAALSVSRFLTHLAVVQALHLCGNILFNRPKQENGEAFFPLFAVAVKGAQSMGLHRDPDAWGLDAQEANRRRVAFWELLALDRMSSFKSGRPYTIHAAHYDTAMPEATSSCCKDKWRLAEFLGEAIDNLWSVKQATYTVVTTMDQKLRALFIDSIGVRHCRALPTGAFSQPGSIPPVLPEGVVDAEVDGALKDTMEQHTWAMTYSAVLFYMHKAAFAQSLDRYPDEPLQSPWGLSVRVVVLEAASYILNLARSWMSLNTALCSRWWHISFHLFVAGVAQSSYVIRSPSSMLTPHALAQLKETVSIFEMSALDGTPGAILLPRMREFRQKAHHAVFSARNIPRPPSEAGSAEEVSSTALDLLSLGTTTRWSRSTKSAATPGVSAPSTADPAQPALPLSLPFAYPHHPYDATASSASAAASNRSYLDLLAAAHNRPSPYFQPPPSSAGANGNGNGSGAGEGYDPHLPPSYEGAQLGTASYAPPPASSFRSALSLLPQPSPPSQYPPSLDATHPTLQHRYSLPTPSLHPYYPPFGGVLPEPGTHFRPPPPPSSTQQQQYEYPPPQTAGSDSSSAWSAGGAAGGSTAAGGAPVQPRGPEDWAWWTSAAGGTQEHPPG